MKNQTMHKHLFPIIDAMVDSAIEELDEDEQITCGKGKECDHCCHLLIEISWDEATELVEWIEEQPESVRVQIIQRVRENAAEAKRLFNTKPSTVKFMKPVIDESEIDDDIFDSYFYDKKRPCPFLNTEEGVCIAYHSRPTSCRLHLVSSDPRLCSAAVGDNVEGYEIPDAIEELKTDAGKVIGAVEKDPRWGHFGIMVEAVLEERKRENLAENQPVLKVVGS